MPNREKYKLTPIVHEYAVPSQALIQTLKEEKEAVEIFENPSLTLFNSYHCDGIGGTSPRMFARKAVATRLDAISKSLFPEMGLLLFDTFRTVQTQTALFEKIFAEVRNRYPHWQPDAVMEETRRYVAHPGEPSRFEVPPHNSGGAVDLTLCADKLPCEMGTEFDNTTEVAGTAYFEREFSPSLGITESKWQTIRENRRLLFHSMASAGFVNYPDEWWHYDLGDCLWADVFKLPWIYDSMEQEVGSL